MAKAKKKAAGGGGGPKEMLLVASKVKAMIKDAGCNTAGADVQARLRRLPNADA